MERSFRRTIHQLVQEIASAQLPIGPTGLAMMREDLIDHTPMQEIASSPALPPIPPALLAMTRKLCPTYI